MQKIPGTDLSKYPIWHLYILRCCDGSFYTGVTIDVERRYRQHMQGRASRYTRSRRPLTLVYSEICGERSLALSREFAVKSLSRKQKEELIRHSASDSVNRD